MITQKYIKNKCRRGVTLVELLMALAITAIMLVAVATAFSSAFDSYKANNEMTGASASSRNALSQFCAIVRSASNDPDSDTIDVAFDGMSMTMVDSAGRVVDYAYDTGDSTLKTRIDNGTWYTVLDNVSAISGQPVFTASLPLDATLPTGTVGVVRVKFAVTNGSVSRTISASAVPRNVIYR
ncbi:MAG: prepilin-type N-terminal cleavage/methylation domain-containing protein [Phycisphaerae bacterium]|nr:prepilin-type N-terminal cleavage/methylation domain-containing protein [Phycisphaerae bacterium]